MRNDRKDNRKARRRIVARTFLTLGAAFAILAAVGLGKTRDDDSGLPLHPTRSVRFVTDEGTWMSVDVSPDGGTIVFDLLGDLYTIPLEGGDAKRITSGMAFDAQPRYSPDGGQIVFTSDRDGWVNVWVAGSDGSNARQITHYRAESGGGSPLVESPEWLPDGSGIVLAERLHGQGGEQRLVEYPASTQAITAATRETVTGGSRLTPDHEGDTASLYRGPAFGRDPRYIYASTKRGLWSNDVWQIVKIDRTSHTVSPPETTPWAGSAVRPALSPDGRHLVFGAPSGEGTGLRIRDLTTDREWWLVRRAQRCVAEVMTGRVDTGDLLPGSSFTPDSKAFVTAFDGKIWRIEVATGEAKPIPFNALVDQQVGPAIRFQYPIRDGSFDLHAIRTPNVSPDGRRVAFTALDRIWIMDLPPDRRHSINAVPTRGGGTAFLASGEVPSPARRLTAGSIGEYFPSWSPDGHYILYATWSDADGGAIYRARVDGQRAPERLTSEAGFYTKPIYTYDGSSVLAVTASAQAVRVAQLQLSRAALGSLQLVRVDSNDGRVRPFARYNVPDLASYNWKPPAFVYGQPHLSQDHHRVVLYEYEGGLLSVSLDGESRHVILDEVTSRPAALGRPERLKAQEVLLAPDGRAALAIAEGSDLAYLVKMPGRDRSAPASISLTETQRNPDGVTVRQISQMGVDFIGWTADNRPYFSVGNLLFLAERQPDFALDIPTTFQEIRMRASAQRDVAAGALLLRGGRILTMRDHEVIVKGDLLVRDGRIAAVSASGNIATPADATVLDMSGTTILPGYIDVHDHVGHRVAYGTHGTQEARLLADLAYGVTTLRDPLAYGPDLASYAERAAAGDLVAPRIFTVNAGIRSSLFGDGADQTLAQTRQALRRWSDAYHSETIKQYLSGGRRTRQLIAIAALEQGLTPTNEGATETAMDLTMVLDGYSAIEHALPVTPIFNDVVQLFARTGTIQTPTFGAGFLFQPFIGHEDITSDRKLRRFISKETLTKMVDRTVRRPGFAWSDDSTIVEVAHSAAQLMAAGVCVAMGSHGNIPGIGAHYELWYLAKGGMPLYDALRAGTVCGAEAIGHLRDLGSLEPGKLADLQILAMNPLDDIKNTRTIRYVMKDGRLYDADTLNEVWPRPRSLQSPVSQRVQ